ncbi:MAG: ribosomal RNA small subunit methyltransferase A [Aquificota bacterium]|uniref:Ribosomal RNA small subunit methyltransferase A n=1 Tax=Thermosulfidibacter takaii TaxID=412593 RepID=A0A7C0Y7P8_9BACT|nr:MAG: ribosomal RNA small subunit methyltransferase A [Aquificota bacterium]HDD52865.1 ribosomal RNA small subunit methyltransferase A [Thermosulfidibacter takaii]
MKSCVSLYRMLREKGFSPSKKLGQNFLVDDNIREIILEASRLAPGEKILEVGPGNGALTVGLLTRGAEVWAVEKDTQLCRFLRELLGNHSTFHLIEGDAMKIPLENLPPEKLVANLPYNITSPLLYRLWEKEGRYQKMAIMVQWEVAQRLTALPGTKDYSLLTVLLTSTHEVKVVHRVSRHCFRPVPEVDSAIVKIQWRGPAMGPLKETYKILAEAGFQHRRKTLANSLKKAIPGKDWEELLEKAGIPPKARAQELSPEEWIALAREANSLARSSRFKVQR